MDRDVAAEMFGKMLFEQGVVTSNRTMMKLLNQPPATHRAEWQAAKNWHKKASNDERALLYFLVEQATIISTFNVACKLDKGLDEKENRLVNYTVIVNTYPNREAAIQASPEESVQVCPTVSGEDIHDILMSYVDRLEA